jgi:hypothetical protein
MKKPRLGKAATAPNGRRRPQTHRKAVTRGLTPLLLAIASALIVLPTTIVVSFGLAPSFAAFVVDDGRPRYLFRTVLGMNTAALLPYVERLWVGGNDLRGAFAIVGDLYAWLAIYGAAAVGWLAFLGAPAVVSEWRKLAAARRVEKLKARQRELMEEWGAALPTEDSAPEPAPQAAAAQPVSG